GAAERGWLERIITGGARRIAARLQGARENQKRARECSGSHGGYRRRIQRRMLAASWRALHFDALCSRHTFQVAADNFWDMETFSQRDTSVEHVTMAIDLGRIVRSREPPHRSAIERVDGPVTPQVRAGLEVLTEQLRVFKPLVLSKRAIFVVRQHRPVVSVVSEGGPANVITEMNA